MDEENIKIEVLDGVKIDYPGNFFSFRNAGVPIYDRPTTKYDEARYPVGQFMITISESQSWKVIGIEIDLKQEVMIFYLREF